MFESVQNAFDWRFMDEPVYRWFLFLGVLILMLLAWNRILNALS